MFVWNIKALKYYFNNANIREDACQKVDTIQKMAEWIMQMHTAEPVTAIKFCNAILS